MRLSVPSRAKRAFTLIELTVVIVLIGILSAMLIPEMRGTYEDALLRSTSRKLVDVFGLASSRAVSQNQLHRVQLNLRTGHFFIEHRVRETPQGIEFAPVQDAGSEGDLDTRIAIRLQQPGDDTGDNASPPAGDDTQVDDNQTVSFYSDGTADPCEFVLRDREGFQLALRINPVTAGVRIVEMERE